MKTPDVYLILDCGYALLVSLMVVLLTSSWLPVDWHPIIRMITGMFLGMILGHIAGFIFFIPLGMFEAMYLGSFCGMVAGMCGAMLPVGIGIYKQVKIAICIGITVWILLELANSSYQIRSVLDD